MTQHVETILTIDEQGRIHLEGPAPPGRHRVIVLVDDTPDTDAWEAFVTRTYGSLAESDLERPPQGEYERRDALA